LLTVHTTKTARFSVLLKTEYWNFSY